jgi:hypothetical protein
MLERLWPMSYGLQICRGTTMWLEHLGLVGTTVAAVNGVLAITIALMPRGSQVAKVRIGALAFVLGLLALIAALYPHSPSGVPQQAAAEGDVRSTLDGFIRDGTALLRQIKDPQQSLPNKQADLWAQQAELFLRERLGEPYVVRYRADLTEMFSESEVPAERLGYWRAVRNRVINLQKVSAEFPLPQ